VLANPRGFPPDCAAQFRINSDSERAAFVAKPISGVRREIAVSPKAGGFPPLGVTLAKKSRQFPNGCALPAVSRLVAQRKRGFHCGVNSGFRFGPLFWRDQSKQSGVVFVAGNQSPAELTFQPF